ncbi:hypothetical protein [Steroidobacter agaridevorans]|uniref:hypothetical protein n=1 Tax=Steroidobacter agaridevorans TaxID=2695856 RepID=UPI00132252F0|nr:hypothetical protein [Steroidobacter agaridevorans]GFE89754.1 hypothetical protein GCM10011488_47080 [Steroidobacter agaridevorans]
MLTKPFRMTVILLIELVLPANAERTALPDLAAPPQGSTQWIARNMRMNGLPMSLKTFESRLSPDAVLAHYESELRSSGSHDVRRSVNSSWQVLLLKSRDHFITVHARRAASGSEGTILVSPALDPGGLKLQTDFPRPSTARIVNLQQYDDSGMQSEHISLSSERAPFIEAQAFSQLLITNGWNIIDTRPTRESYRGFVLEAQRQAEQALLVIIPDAARPASTAIVVTWKKS